MTQIIMLIHIVSSLVVNWNSVMTFSYLKLMNNYRTWLITPLSSLQKPTLIPSEQSTQQPVDGEWIYQEYQPFHHLLDKLFILVVLPISLSSLKRRSSAYAGNIFLYSCYLLARSSFYTNEHAYNLYIFIFIYVYF